MPHKAVTELEQIFQEHETYRRRRRTRDAVDAGVPLDEIAAVVVAYTNDMILRGATSKADEVIWQAVHDGVPPHKLFIEIKRLCAVVEV